MASSSSSSSSYKGPQKETVTTTRYLHINRAVDYPFNGLDLDGKTSMYAATSKTLFYCYILDDMLKANAESHRWTKDNMSAGNIDYGSWNTFCSLAFISSHVPHGRVEGGFGMNSGEVPRSIATATVVPCADPDSKKIIAIIYSFSYAVSEAEIEKELPSNETEVKPRDLSWTYSPVGILIDQIDYKDDCAFAIATNNDTKLKRKRRNIKPVVQNLPHLTSLFQSLTKPLWKSQANAYRPKPGAFPTFDDVLSNQGSDYNPYNVFSLQAAIDKLKQAVYANASLPLSQQAHPDFLQSSWTKDYNPGVGHWQKIGTSHGGVAHGFYPPHGGQYTYRFQPRDYRPDYINSCMLPHIEPIMPSEHDEKFRKMWAGCYGKPLPTPEEGERLEGKTKEAYLFAKRTAQFNLLDSLALENGDDGSLLAFSRLCAEEQKQVTAVINKEIETYKRELMTKDGIWNTTRQGLAATRAYVMKRDWKIKKFKQLRARFNPENTSSLSKAECATAAYQTEHLSKYKNFCLPLIHRFKDLTPFANMIATILLGLEMGVKSYISHAQILLGLMCCHTTWMGLPQQMRCNLMLLGRAMTGKSFIWESLMALLIDGTSLNLGSSTPKAMLQAGNNNMHKCCIFEEEASSSKYGIGEGSGKTGRGASASADTQANSDIAAIFRQILTNGTHTREETVRDLDGNFKCVMRTMQFQMTMFVATNARMSDLAENTLSRFMAYAMEQIEARTDVSQSEAVASSKGPAAKDRKQSIGVRCMRDQLMVSYIAELINSKIFDVGITTTLTDMLFARIQKYMHKNGNNKIEADSRAVHRALMLILPLCLWEKLYIVFDSPMAWFDSEADWKEEDWDRFLDIESLLVTSPEHLIYVTTLVANQWEDPTVAKFATLMIQHYNIDIATNMTWNGLAAEERKLWMQRYHVTVRDPSELQRVNSQVLRLRSIISGGTENAPVADHVQVLDSKQQMITMNRFNAVDAEAGLLESIDEFIDEGKEEAFGDNSISTERLVAEMKKSSDVKRAPTGLPTIMEKLLDHGVQLADPEIHEGIKMKRSDQAAFIYLRWLKLKMARAKDGMSGPKLEEDGDEIDELAVHMARLTNQAGVDPKPFRILINRAQDDTIGLTSDPSRKVAMMRWFTASGQRYLRISKAMFANGGKSNIFSAIEELTGTYATRLGTIATGVFEKPYLMKLIKVPAASIKDTITLRNPLTDTQQAQEISDQLFGSHGTNGIKLTSMTSIQKMIKDANQSIEEYTYSESSISPMRHVCTYHAAMTGIPEAMMRDYKGTPMVHHFVSPEEAHIDYKLGGVVTHPDYTTHPYESLNLYAKRTPSLKSWTDMNNLVGNMHLSIFGSSRGALVAAAPIDPVLNRFIDTDPEPTVSLLSSTEEKRSGKRRDPPMATVFQQDQSWNDKRARYGGVGGAAAAAPIQPDPIPGPSPHTRSIFIDSSALSDDLF
jgi:hypothetical protein